MWEFNLSQVLLAIYFGMAFVIVKGLRLWGHSLSTIQAPSEWSWATWGWRWAVAKVVRCGHAGVRSWGDCESQEEEEANRALRSRVGRDTGEKC